MELRETRKVIKKFGRYAVEQAQRELTVSRRIRGKKAKRYSSGQLHDNLTYKERVTKNRTVIDFFAKGSAGKYADFIEQGVSGTKVKFKTPYSFKSKFVNIGAIEKWIRQKPVRLRDKDGKFIKQSEKNIKRAAFVMARSIAEKGIVGIQYFQKGVSKALDKYGDELAEAIANDIEIRL